MLSGILRAMGDGRTPLVAVTAASFINIALDCLMIFGMHTGVAGAAVATVIAQGTAAWICLKKLKKLGAYAAEGRTRDSRTRAALLKNGFPQAFMHTVTAAGCLVVQGAVNGLGVGAAAAYSVCGKYLNLFMLPSLTAGLAVSVFAGQNAGAGKADRIRSGVRAGSGIAAFAWFAAGGAMCLFSSRLAMLMISGEEAVSLSAGYLEICGTGLILLNLLFVFRGCFQGMGKPVVPMCSGIAEMAVRIGVIAVFAKRLGFVSVGIAEIAAWACALLMNMAGYVVAIRKMGK
jgi:Na+-driven multidrug efflux pump